MLAIWTVIYLSLKSRGAGKEMLKVSLWTSILGLTEPLFVPEYWNPPSLFDLAQRTGFDIESLIFSFAIGGIAAILYEKIFGANHQSIPIEERKSGRHWFHPYALISAPLILIALLIFTEWNPIYSSIIAMVAAGILSVYCRSDLAKKMLTGAFLFLIFYFLSFLMIDFLSPGYVEKVWNLGALSGILIFGVPLEELLFAAAVGFLWSGIYEHFAWRRLKSVVV